MSSCIKYVAVIEAVLLIAFIVSLQNGSLADALLAFSGTSLIAVSSFAAWGRVSKADISILQSVIAFIGITVMTAAAFLLMMRFGSGDVSADGTVHFVGNSALLAVLLNLCHVLWIKRFALPQE